MSVREQERRIKAERRSSDRLRERFLNWATRVDSLLDGPLWMELTVEEKSALALIRTQFIDLGNARRGAR